MNFNKFLRLLQNKNFKEKLNENDLFKNENLVLVLGNTMAGKSTIINYFLNNLKLEINQETMEPYYERIDSNKGPKIGHSRDASETKTVETFKCDFDDTRHVYLCDFPGFFNTDELEENIVLALSIKHLSKRFIRFLAIFVVISEDDLRAARAVCFKQLLSILNDLFIDLDSIKDSLMFIFNKSKYGKSVELCKTIRNGDKDELKLLDFISDPSRFTKCIQNFDVNNEDQHKESIRNEIFNYLFNSDKIKSQSIKTVNFNNYDKCLKEFNQNFQEILENDVNKLFEARLNLDMRLKELKNELNEMNKTKNELKIKLKHLENEVKCLNLDDFTRQIITCEDTIKNYNDITADKKQRLKKCEEDIEKLENNLFNLENDNVIDFKHDEFEEPRQCLEMFAWSKHVFDYNNSDMPFQKAVINYDKNNGSLTVHLNQGSLGRYKATYTSNWRKPGKASLILSIKKRDFYKQKIDNIKSELLRIDTDKNFIIQKQNEYERKINEQYERKIQLNSQKLKYEQNKIDLITFQNNLIELETLIKTTLTNKDEKLSELNLIESRLESKQDIIKCAQFLLEHFADTYSNNQVFLNFNNLLPKVNEINKHM